MKRVLVTGASGFIGAKITLFLSNYNFEVIALCRKDSFTLREKFKKIQVIIGDFNDPEIISKLFSYNIDHVIHTVSLDQVSSEKKNIYEVNNVNVLAPWILLEEFVKKKRGTFINLSTIQTIGIISSPIVTESTKKFPINKYALSHSIFEEIVSYYHKKNTNNCISLRLSNGYGVPIFEEGKCWDLVVNTLCKSAFIKNEIILNSDGNALRDFIYIDDVISAIYKIIQISDHHESLLNVSSGNTYSLLELAHLIKKIYEERYGKKINVYKSSIQLSEKVTFTQSRYIICNERLKEFGFEPRFSLENGIIELFKYLENINDSKN